MKSGAGQTTHPTTRSLIACAAIAGGCAALGWQLGAVAVGVTVISATLVALRLPRWASSREGEPGHELREHLARARRREESVDLLVARADDGSPGVARRLEASLRVTDSACLCEHRGALELIAVVDRERLDRRALEARLREAADGPMEIGWARFPEDGYTLSSLVGDARQGCQSADEAGDPVVQPVAALAPGVVGP